MELYMLLDHLGIGMILPNFQAFGNWPVEIERLNSDEAILTDVDFSILGDLYSGSWLPITACVYKIKRKTPKLGMERTHGCFFDVIGSIWHWSDEDWHLQTENNEVGLKNLYWLLQHCISPESGKCACTALVLSVLSNSCYTTCNCTVWGYVNSLPTESYSTFCGVLQ